MVKKQVELGIDVVSDGEQSKTSFNNYITERLTGFEPRAGIPSGAGNPAVAWSGSRERAAFPEFYEWYGRQVSAPLSNQSVFTCTGPITYRGARRGADRHRQPQGRGDRRPAPSRRSCRRSRRPRSPPAGPTSSTRATRSTSTPSPTRCNQEYHAIVDAGLVLQIDDPRLSSQYTMTQNVSVEDTRKWIAQRIEVINYSLKGIPEEAVRFHTCYSIDIGPRLNDLALKDIADLMLRLNTAAYSFEASNPRHEHEYHLWETLKLPEGKVLIPGFVSHTTHLVEHPELVAERIVRYAKHRRPRERDRRRRLRFRGHGAHGAGDSPDGRLGEAACPRAGRRAGVKATLALSLVCSTPSRRHVPPPHRVSARLHRFDLSSCKDLANRTDGSSDPTHRYSRGIRSLQDDKSKLRCVSD